MEIVQGVTQLAICVAALVVYLFGFKLFRWWIALLTAATTGCIAYFVVGLMAAAHGFSGGASISNALSAGNDTAKLALLVAAVAGFLLAYFFQQVMAAITNALVTAGLVFVFVRVTSNSSDSTGPAFLFAAVTAVLVGVLTLKLYDYVAAVSILLYTYPMLPPPLSGEKASVLNLLLADLLNGKWPSRAFEQLITNFTSSLWSSAAAFLLSVVVVIWLRATCWTSRDTKAKTKLRPELRAALLATGALLAWNALWMNLLTPVTPVLYVWPLLWPVMLLAHQRFVAPLGELQPGNACPQLALPKDKNWLVCIAAGAVALPLATAVVQFVINDIPLFGSDMSNGTFALLSSYYQSFLQPHGELGVFGLLVRWCSVCVVVPMAIDWMRRASPAMSDAVNAADALATRGAADPGVTHQHQADDTEKDAEITPQPWGAGAKSSARIGLREHWALLVPRQRVAILSGAVGIVVTILVVASAKKGTVPQEQSEGDSAAFVANAVASGLASGLTSPTRASGDTSKAALTRVQQPSAAKLTPDATTASSFISSRYESHPAEHAFDNNPKTAWNEGAPGSGRNEWLEASFAQPVRVHRIELATGYDALSPKYGDLFTLNAHVRRVSVLLDGNVAVSRDVRADERTVVLEGLDQSVTHIRFVFDEVWDGSKWHDLCVSEVAIYGEK